MVKRNLGKQVHVTQGYGKTHPHRQHKNIHYEGEDYKVEIRKFDRNYDKIYTINQINYKNLEPKNWRNLKILYCPDTKKKPNINIDYECKETGTYIVDTLYYDYNYDETKCWDYGAGATKVALFFEGYPYVIKIPFYGEIGMEDGMFHEFKKAELING